MDFLLRIADHLSEKNQDEDRDCIKRLWLSPIKKGSGNLISNRRETMIWPKDFFSVVI